MIEATAESLKAEIEKLFPVGQPTSMYLSVTGEPYVEITSAGRHEEGVADIKRFSTGEAAYSGALTAFTQYAEGKSGVLYWRATPEIERYQGGFAFYMRCLISDKPVLAKDHDLVRSYYEAPQKSLTIHGNTPTTNPR